MRYFFGSMLIGCGVLIAGTMGLCTLLILSSSQSYSFKDVLQGAALLGVPFAIGIGLIIAGTRMMRGGGGYR